MALYMLKTDNIWGVASLHGAWNFAQGNLVGVAVSGQNAGGELIALPRPGQVCLIGYQVEPLVWKGYISPVSFSWLVLLFFAYN